MKPGVVGLPFSDGKGLAAVASKIFEEMKRSKGVRFRWLENASKPNGPDLGDPKPANT
jgi:hypothetical protein